MKNNFGRNIIIKDGVIIGSNVQIDDDVYLDYGVIIRDNVHIKKGSFIGARSILGEYLGDFFENRVNKSHKLIIGENSIIRSENIIYGDVCLGANFQTGHRVTIRENVIIGDNSRIGTNSDIQDNVVIGNFVNIHSDCFISAKNVLEDYVWIFPRVVFTNDPTPPSNELVGSIIRKFASIGAGSIILPGAVVESNTLIAAGSTVKGVLEEGGLYVGNPTKRVKNIVEIKNKVTGKSQYPWMYSFNRGMPWGEDGFDKWNKK